MKLEQATPDALQHSPISIVLWLTLAATLARIFALIGISGIYRARRLSTRCIPNARIKTAHRNRLPIDCLSRTLPLQLGWKATPNFFGDELLLLP